MIKSVFAASAALSLSAGAAFAGPYVNVETNAGYTGNDYNAATTDLHVGYEGPIGDNAGYYVQAGPAIVAQDGVDTSTQISGKAGLGVDIAESVNVYGELAFVTVEDTDEADYNVKAGVTYRF